MPSLGEQQVVPGAALVMAVSPTGRIRLVDATSVLGPMSAVPAGVLAGTAAGSVTQLVSPADPQAVLAQLRTVARAEGPLTLFLFGQLHLDQRQGLPHVALANTRPATVRYTALPWSWIADELRSRRSATAVFVDLVADKPAWQHVAAQPLSLGSAVALFGVVSPPPSGRCPVQPVYAHALAALLRGQATRPPLHELHRVALGRAGVDAAAVVLSPCDASPGVGPAAPRQRAEAPVVRPVEPESPAVSAVVDPHPAILEAARAGRHGEAASAAAAWEQYALRTYGAGSREAVHWVEVRADLARLAADPVRSCQLWLMAAAARLAAGQAADDPKVEAAVDRAHHQWEQIGDRPRARELLGSLSPLREQVPGRQPGARDALQRRAEAFTDG